MIERVKRTQATSAQINHPDAPRNFSYARDWVKKNQNLLKRVEVAFEGVNKDSDGHHELPTNVSFYWKDKDMRYGFPVGYHMPLEEFRTNLDKFINSKLFQVPYTPPKPIEWLKFDGKEEEEYPSTLF